VGAQTDLPVHLTTFVGRARELAELHDLLDRARLVTLAGSGGCGKTRLATELARRRAERYDRVSFVDLSAVGDVGGVLAALAEHVAPSATTMDGIGRVLGDQRLLLVLDNCEHLIEACADAADALLRACPHLVVVTTSREPLGVGGEVTYRVASLTDDDAAELFEERARRARPSLLDRELELIPAICEGLDGIPLAIELAAARMRVLTAAQIRDGLRDRLGVLTGGVRGAVARHQTLEASFDWSYELLLDAERALLRRLSVFAGGFTLASAEAVGASGDIARHDVLDLLSQLVDKSLVAADGERFRLLETVRQYAALRLADAGEADGAWRRFYEHFVAFTRVDPDESEPAYAQRMRDDYENLRRALQWAADQAEVTQLAVLVGGMTRFWATGRATGDGARWAMVVSERGEDLDVRVRAEVLRAAAQLRGLHGHWLEAHTLSLRAVDLVREAAHPKALARTLAQAALHARNADMDGSDALLDEALELAESFGPSATRAFVLYTKAFLLVREDGEIERGITLLEEALDVAVRTGSEPVALMCRSLLALVAPMIGEIDAAIEELEAAVATMDDLGAGFAIADHYLALAMCHAVRGDDAALACAVRDLGTVAAEMGGPNVAGMHELATAVAESSTGQWRAAADRLASLQLAFELRSRPIRSALLTYRALAELHAGDLAAAARSVEEARALGSWHPWRHPLPYLDAVLAVARGDLDEADTHARAALAEVTGPVAAVFELECLLVNAVVARRQGRHDDAVRILAAALAHASRVGASTTSPTWRAMELGELDAIRAEASAVEVPPALDEIVTFLRRGRGPRRRPSSGWASLTPTETQVVELVTRGAPNKEIAERLYMSVATVKSHLTHVYGKLGIGNRAELAAEATKRAHAAPVADGASG
jgi:predicted ATPase/DNA-binding CsgD family transcriptional regulator